MENKLHKPYYYGFADLDVAQEAKRWSLKPLPYMLAVLAATLAAGLIFLCITAKKASAAEIPSSRLAMGLIAEDTGGNYLTYLSIASCVRNRLNIRLQSGLVALKRKDLSKFVQRNREYVLRTKGIDLTLLANKAIDEVFRGGKDYVNDGNHYEHTGVYKTPAWAKKMTIAKILYPKTKREITFYKARLQ